MEKEKNNKSEVARREEEVLAYWQEHDIFHKSLEKDAPKGDFVFYDGPPFATGLPHVGSLLSSVIKDVVGRYWTMKGYYVERRWGWDCHGLPIENLVEKELGLKNKKEIYDLGIGKFNEACRAAVLRYANDWKEYVTRIGRWTEYDGAYKTMDNTYMESVWWFLSEMHKKGQLYEGRKVLLYCPHCETPLSKAEIAMDNSYKDVTEESVYVKFKVRNPEEIGLDGNVYLLAWTTTPWTLPGNVALAVGGDIDYDIEEISEKKDSAPESERVVIEKIIFAKDLRDKILSLYRDEAINDIVTGKTTRKTVKGKELVGLRYEPLYDIEKVEAEKKENAFTVLPADFVTTEDGTGIVHTAVIYGEDDFRLGSEHDLPMVPLLDSAGHFLPEAPDLIQGLYFKKAEKTIKQDLEERGLMFKKEIHTHSYPHCYRCGTALLYNAIVSWFIDVQKIRKQMLDTNEEINWYPEHLKHGRYLNIIENAPDWSISRNRFWATPLPIWRNPKTGEYKVIGSLVELKKYVHHSGNTYYLMRHGEAKSNAGGYTSTDINEENPLTEKGLKQIEDALVGLSEKNIDLIIASPFQRTKTTAEIIAKAHNIPIEDIVYDDRIGEIKLGELNGKQIEAYHSFLDAGAKWCDCAPEGGESWQNVKRRAGEFLYEIDRKYENKNILIIAHNSPLRMFGAINDGLALETTEFDHDEDGKKYANAEVRELPFVPLPHNDNYELDYHRPYIDEIELFDRDGTKLERAPEVVDCWAESGSMPFAARNYPHSNRDTFDRFFPADFIAEYIAQTRTWFYYMHTVAVLLFGKSSFKNVVTTGNVLADDGSKMSKSKQNYTDPLVNLDMYGADAMRYYLMSSVVMQAEDMSFKDQELKEVHNRLINILWNTYKFYDLYKDTSHDDIKPRTSENILDTWIIARLDELTKEMTKHMDGYNMTKASRPVRDFVEDFSTWYVRRSRDRFKGTDLSDKKHALATTRYVFVEFSKLIAPLMPFMAESLYRGVEGEKESVHLEPWPDAQKIDEKVLESMAVTREVVSRALEARASADIKVRQPLQKLSVKQDSAALYEPYLALIKDEVNVKEVIFDGSISGDVLLDTAITFELQAEGEAREFMRQVQDMRKKAGLSPQDRIALTVETQSGGQTVLEAHKEEITKTVGADTFTFEKTEGEGITIGDSTFMVSIVKTE